VLSAAVALAAGMPADAGAATLSATPASLSSVFSSAGSGDTIILGAGSYGTFRGALKSGEVTLKAQTGATVSMALDFDPASNITIDGVTLTSADLSDSATKNITVRNSDIPGQTTLRTGELQNANILFDHNVHRDYDKCSSCGEGRIWLPESTSQPSGITIQDSEFKGGLSDGILNGSNATQIINNVFHDLEHGTSDGVHTDAIQLYGSKNTLIRANYFYNVPDAIMAPDGADHEIIEDNVIAADPGGYPFAIMLWSDNASIIRHNTLADGACAFSVRCGIISIGSKTNQDAGHGTIIKDNILGELSLGSASATIATSAYNLYRSAANTSTDQHGLPTYANGPQPATYTGYTLATGSIGTNNASDGLNRGIRTTLTTPPPPPPPAPAPPPTPELTQVVPKTLAQILQALTPEALGALLEALDPAPPRTTTRLLATMSSLGRNGKLRLRITTTDPTYVAITGRLRPGAPVDPDRGPRSPDLIEVPPSALALPQAGAHAVSIKIPAAGRRVLHASRSARLSLQLRATDVAQNSSVEVQRLAIKR